jgi:hypothetical protein
MTRRRRNTEIKAQASLDFARDNAIHGGKSGNRLWKQAMKDLG